MEKIKQALERARQEQPSPSRAAVSPKRSGSERGEAREIQNISYNKTRVVEISRETLHRNHVVVGSGEHAAAETAYKILRTQVDQRLAARSWNAVAVTSAGAAVGKTITAINLSMALAQEVHRTVLLVDLDFRNPSVHKRFEFDVEFGLIDYLLDDVPLNEILVNPGIDRLVLLPAGANAIPNSSELLASPKMVKLVEELKARYPSRIIVFDMPPLLWSDDALAFSPYVDTTLLVVAEGLTTKEELRRVQEIIGRDHLLGTVLNRSTDVQPSYYYNAR